MNRDEILAIAREVENHAGWSALYLMGEDLAVAFASRIESLVREECARTCDEIHQNFKRLAVQEPEPRGRVFVERGYGAICCRNVIRKSEG
jgi:hypothetical protein